MFNRAARDSEPRRLWPTPSIVVASAAIVLSLSGSAVAASLIRTKDIATGAVTSAKIKDGSITRNDFNAATRAMLPSAPVVAVTGATGAAGTNGANGPNGASGTNGA